MRLVPTSAPAASGAASLAQHFHAELGEAKRSLCAVELDAEEPALQQKGGMGRVGNGRYASLRHQSQDCPNTPSR